jgi:hypothetical protein
VEARIAKRDLHPRPRRRVALQKGVEILLKPLENHESFDIFRVFSALTRRKGGRIRRSFTGNGI